MRANQWKRLAAQVIEPVRPALTLTGSLIHAPHMTTILRGLAKDTSGFSTDFAVWAFVQPLGVPEDHLFFSYGMRLRRRQQNREWWPSDPHLRAGVIEELRDAVTRQALPLLDRMGSAQGLLDHIEGRKDWTADPNHIEAAACCVIELDDRPRALALEGHLRQTNWSPNWQWDVAQRASRRLDEFLSDPESARRRLLETSAATAATLGLSRSEHA